MARDSGNKGASTNGNKGASTNGNKGAAAESKPAEPEKKPETAGAPAAPSDGAAAAESKPGDPPARVPSPKTQADLFSELTAAQNAKTAAEKSIESVEEEIAFRLYTKGGRTTLPDGRSVRARKYAKTGKLILVEIGSAKDVEI